MTRQSRILAGPVLAVAVALAASAGAQVPTPSPSPSPTDPRPTLELSLQDAVARTLESNADIAVERYNPQASAEDVRAAKGVYDPFVFASVNRSSSVEPAADVFAGAAQPEDDVWSYDFGASQYLPTGGDLSLRFNNSRTSTNRENRLFSPSLFSDWTLSATQPLLRNLKMDGARRELTVSKRNLEISDTQFRQTVLNTLAGVKQLYYDFIYAIDNLEAQRKSLALAQKFLDENQIKVKVGTMAPLDVVAAESEVALREESVILAEAALADAEDAIKRSIAPQHDPVIWSQRIVPTERPSAEPFPVDTETAIRNALEKRTDVRVARLNLENAQTTFKFARSQHLPQLDATAGYGVTAVGGTPNPQNPGAPPAGSGVLSNLFGRDFPSWRVGFTFSYPILNRQASAGRAQAQIAVDQTQASLRRLELGIVQEVRSTARAVETNFKRIQSTRSARILQERRLDAEEKRFAAGMSTNFLVTQAQRDLAFAEVAELRAVADYRKSLVDFERVQEAGGGVNFGAASLAGLSASRNLTPSANTSLPR